MFQKFCQFPILYSKYVWKNVQTELVDVSVGVLRGLYYNHSYTQQRPPELNLITVVNDSGPTIWAAYIAAQFFPHSF